MSTDSIQPKGNDRIETLRLLEEMSRNFHELVPHAQALGMRLGALGDGYAELLLPYKEELVGDPETGVLHGGAVTAFMDSCCGAAVFMALHAPAPIATLDLRIDYLRPAKAGVGLKAKATCYRVARHVAFVRGEVSDLESGELVAHASGCFMLSTRKGRDKATDASAREV